MTVGVDSKRCPPYGLLPRLTFSDRLGEDWTERKGEGTKGKEEKSQIYLSRIKWPGPRTSLSRILRLEWRFILL